MYLVDPVPSAYILGCTQLQSSATIHETKAYCVIKQKKTIKKIGFHNITV